MVVSIKQSRRIHIPCNNNLDVFFHFVRSVRHVEILNRVKYRGMIFLLVEVRRLDLFATEALGGFLAATTSYTRT